MTSSGLDCLLIDGQVAALTRDLDILMWDVQRIHDFTAHLAPAPPENPTEVWSELGLKWGGERDRGERKRQQVTSPSTCTPQYSGLCRGI